MNEPIKSFNDFDVLHHDNAMPDNTNYSKEQNAIRSKTIADNVNFKETHRPQVVVNEFPERQHTFLSIKLSPANNLTMKQQIPEFITAITYYF